MPTLHKPATTITDYLLTLECAWFVWVLVGRSTPGFVRSGFIALFASVAAAAFFGDRGIEIGDVGEQRRRVEVGESLARRPGLGLGDTE